MRQQPVTIDDEEYEDLMDSVIESEELPVELASEVESNSETRET